MINHYSFLQILARYNKRDKILHLFIFLIQVKQSPSSKLSDGTATPKVGENLDTSCSQSSKKTPGRQKAKVFPEDATPDLIRLVHGNFHNKIFLVKEFSAFLQKLDRKENKSK